MSYIIIADSTDREAWLDARTNGVTATEVATLIRGGAGAWAALRAEKNGAQRSTYQSAAMTWGNDREPIIAEFARSSFGLLPSTKLLAHSEHPQYLATPDGITATGEEVGEYKTTKYDWADLDAVPPRYIDQMFWQMFVTGARKARLLFEPHEDFAPLYPFPKVFELNYDEHRVAELRAVADRFLAGSEEDENAVEIDALVTARVDAKRTADEAAAIVTDLDERIRVLLDGKPIKFEGSLGNLTLGADSTSDRFDSTGFKKADPATYAQYVKTSPVKGRLTITARTDS